MHRLAVLIMLVSGCPAPTPETPPPVPVDPEPATTTTIAEPPPAPLPTPEPATKPEEATGTRPDGSACDVGADCQSGICEGEGCDEEGGTCMSSQRMCTRDLVAYCGCDGKTFRNSGSCPGRRYEKKGPCPGDNPFP